MQIKIDELMITSGVQFGTSGVRGLVVDMTDQVCWLYVTAFLQYLKK
jgi:phosphomannomutase